MNLKKCTMYRLKPIYEIPKKLDLPDCMYKMKNPVACVMEATIHPEEKPMEIQSQITCQENFPEYAALEGRWDGLLQTLSKLNFQLMDMKNTIGVLCRLAGYSSVDRNVLNNLKFLHEAVINANPSKPPYSLLLVRHLLKSLVPIVLNIHTHSTLSSLPDNLEMFSDFSNDDIDKNDCLHLRLIWKADLLDTQLVVNPLKQMPILGEVNILKFFARAGMTCLRYPPEDLLDTIRMDATLDLCHRLIHSSSSKEKVSICKSLNGKLGRHPYFGGLHLNIVDVAAWSILKQVENAVKQDLSSNLQKWYEKMNAITI